MSDLKSDGVPSLSVVLITDTYETIRGVLRRLHEQTVRDRIEVVVVVPAGQANRFEAERSREFAVFRTVEVHSLNPPAKARAAGVRATTAPLIFLGETHAYPHPGLAEALIEANSRGRWAVITPAFENANPTSAFSWAAFLSDYGLWCDGLPGGEINAAPLFNSAYTRVALLELADRIVEGMSLGDELPISLRNGGYACFAPDAHVAHVNTVQPMAWCKERFLVGVAVGGHRGETWTRRRRLFYFLASPLIPIVLLRRIFSAFRRLPHRPATPAFTFPLIILSALLRAAGEAIGYAAGVGGNVEAGVEEFKLHKARYAAKRAARRPLAGDSELVWLKPDQELRSPQSLTSERTDPTPSSSIPASD